MLRELHIRDFSIIDSAAVEFGKGFTVLTGETGAGKSIIINALSLALGERAASEYVRSGTKEAVVEALFDLPSKKSSSLTVRALKELGIEAEDGLILKRIVSSQGKNRAFINSSMANVQTLIEISRGMIDIHGQYEHQSLLSPENQLDLLDLFGGLTKEREAVATAYEALAALKNRIQKLEEQDKERAQRLDILGYQINEIESASLTPGEEEELAAEEKILGSAGHLAEVANQAYDILYASESACLPNLSTIIDNLREITKIDTAAVDSLKSAEEALSLLEEAGYFLRDYKDSVEFNPQRLEHIQERLESVKALKRKYGSSIQEVLEFRDKAAMEHEALHHSEETLGTLKEELEEQKQSFTHMAKDLSKKRQAVARKVESEVVKQLAQLSMPDTQFSIVIEQHPGNDTLNGLQAGSSGIDSIEFMISPNIGEELKPLAKIVSGGELSRIMLALKGIMAKGDKIPVLVFDEIDAGIGGKTAETVGKKLRALSKNHQVICITHLPQIASYADRHLKIEKQVVGKRTVVRIECLDKKERTSEVARMLSGELSEVSLKHAKELLQKSAS
ncbi:MAG: DNA repair protein RecN [Nitrospiraceae bacterium]|nr:MAG: DNA repair protein RecN [Nitrospiraceae bacterium]